MHRPPLARARMLREHAQRPVIAFHLAAMAVQRHARGYVLRLRLGGSSEPRVPRACRRTAAAALARRAALTPAVGDSTGLQPQLTGDDDDADTRAQRTELSLVARFLESKVRHGGSEMQFNDWILLRMQAWARMVPWRAYRRALRDPLLNAAARSIQRAWRSRVPTAQGERRTGRKRGPPSSGRAAFLIQRGWRGFTNRRIFAYLREMLVPLPPLAARLITHTHLPFPTNALSTGAALAGSRMHACCCCGCTNRLHTRAARKLLSRR